MASFNSHIVRPPMSRKRSREEEQDDDLRVGGPDRKYARPTFDNTSSWPSDSLIATPPFSQTKYDSDDLSSIISEPGSPRDVSMPSEDEDGDHDMDATFSQSPEDPALSSLYSSPWKDRVNGRGRIPTPFNSANRTVMRPSMSVRTGAKQHIRQRHPQEISTGSDQVEVPSPIDEDEVATPPSVAAADAAGSRLSMLSMTDLDMNSSGNMPTITLDHSRSVQISDDDVIDDSVFPVDPMDSSADSELVVRKQRQRSGAQSNGSASPIKGDRLSVTTEHHRRGFSIGFRSDCEKCRMRVPGHMNHFILS